MHRHDQVGVGTLHKYPEALNKMYNKKQKRENSCKRNTEGRREKANYMVAPP